jgi:hypothetical protein
MRRLSRLTNGFAKDQEPHCGDLAALPVLHFVRVDQNGLCAIPQWRLEISRLLSAIYSEVLLWGL